MPDPTDLPSGQIDTNSGKTTQGSTLGAAIKSCREAFIGVAVFSAAINILLLAGPLYMLQVYDRVLTSRSVPTLVILTIVLVGAYLFQGAFDVIRSRLVVRISAEFDRQTGPVGYAAVLRLSGTGAQGQASQPIRDLDQIRAFLTSTGPLAIIDLPWIPVFLSLSALIHPWVGLMSAIAALVLLFVTVVSAWRSKRPARNAVLGHNRRLATLEAICRNGESAAAMGMQTNLSLRWADVSREHLEAAEEAADVSNTYASATKMLRLLVQSAVLGLGAYLVILDELSPGAMVAASIMMGRALAPVEMAISNWRSFQTARESIQRLSGTLEQVNLKMVSTLLPAPSQRISVEHIAIAVPSTRSLILGNLSFSLEAGEALAVIGPSASGKTSLARTLVGVWPVARGIIRLDNAATDQWEPTHLGRHIGYVAQSVDLFDGTVAENIARMASYPDSDAVLRAAAAAEAHEMILRLPGGYDARVGIAGAALSAGQRQRIALARALYGDPFLVVLDEPNANLDNDGELALQQVIQRLKARGSIVVLIAHRQSMLAYCDKVLYLANGQQQAFGPRDEVLQRILAKPVPLTPRAAPQAVAEC